MLGEVDRELVQEELRLVVVDVLDVDGEVQVALQRRRDPEIEGLHPQQVNFLPLPVVESLVKQLPENLEGHFTQHFRTSNDKLNDFFPSRLILPKHSSLSSFLTSEMRPVTGSTEKKFPTAAISPWWVLVLRSLYLTWPLDPISVSIARTVMTSDPIDAFSDTLMVKFRGGLINSGALSLKS